MNKIYLLLFLILGSVGVSFAQISMTATGSNTQNFNSLPTSGSITWVDNSTIASWYAQRTGTGTSLVADNGGSNTGNLFNYGTTAATDRAIGSLGSGNAAAGSFAWGVQLQNNSGAAITTIQVSFTGEQWRNSAAAAQTAAFYYKISGSAITALNPNANGTWTAVPALNFTSPITGGTAGALDGNLAANRTTISNIAIPSLSLAAGEYIMLKWDDPDQAGSDHGLSIDDVTIAWTVPAGTPNINISTTSLSGFLSTAGVPTSEQTYNVDGTNLTNDIIIAPPVGYEITTTSGSGYITNPATITLTQSGGTVASTPIYVRMNSSTLGTNTGNIAHTSTGATQKDVVLTGKVLATEPTIQSTVTVVTVTNSTALVNFGGGNGARRILLARQTSAVNSDPVDGTTYTANANFGSGSQIGAGNFVVYDGTGNTQLVTGLTAGAKYHFAIYDYNNGAVAGAENYLVPGGVDSATLLTYSLAYVWIGLNGDWQVPTNWLPTRLFPATNDSLLFTSASINDIITNVPTQTVGYMGASLLTTTTLQAAGTGDTLTIGNLSGTDFFVQAGSAFNINTVNPLTLNLVTGATGSISGAMTFTAGAHKFTAADPGAITFNSGAVFTAGTGFTGNAFGPTPTATPNSVIFSSGSVYRQISGGNPFALTQPASVVVFQTGSLFRLETNITPSVSGRTYANFELDAPSSVIGASGIALLKMDNVTITNGTITFGMTTAGFDLKGNVSVASGATLNFAPASAGMLTFNGTTPQSISNAGTLTFGANQNVTMNNAAGLTLNTPVTLARVLTFTTGLINTSTTNLLTLTAAASVTGASNASFVNGPVSKIGNTPFVFPIGKTNCGPSATVNGYAAAEIGNFTGGAVTDQYTAEYIRGNGAALGPISAVGLDHVSACDYWTLNRPVGTSTVDITLHWSDPVNNCTTASPYVNNLPSLTVAHFDGTTWDAFGVIGTFTGTSAAGTITWSIPQSTTFGTFTIGSVDFRNPLPITINYFTGTKNNSKHFLDWKVTCVSTPSATIELQRSSDGRNYSGIYSIFATALRCAQPFDYTDDQPLGGVNYYRLKMTDADGKITYSSIVSLINAVKGIDVMNIAPNPIVSGNFNLKVSSAEKTQLEVLITDMQGRVLQKRSVNIIAGFNEIPMNVSGLSAGTYQLFGNTADGRTRVLRFVIQ